jgi:hypothetical protein
MAQLPKQVWRVVVRADSAFFSTVFVGKLELLHCGYVIKVKIRQLEEAVCGAGLAKGPWRRRSVDCGIRVSD